MRFIKTASQHECAQVLSAAIAGLLKEGKSVLWLLGGGSNIPISVAAQGGIRAALEAALGPDGRARALSHLSVALTDERYGLVGHVDSNWKQLSDAGFDFSAVNGHPLLDGSDLETTARRYGALVERLMGEADVVIAQLGIGADGHTAGILPQSPAVRSAEAVCAYATDAFTRITLTPKTLLKVPIAYAFVFGEGKRQAVEMLRDSVRTFDDQPAQLLKHIADASLLSDQL